MSEPETTTLTIPQALKLLKTSGCKTVATDISAAETKQLREALLLVVQESEWENLGVCADNLVQGLNALDSYLEAFGYSYNCSQNQDKNLEESVYIKFNTQKMTYYADSYTGNSRGVLVATQGDEEAIVNTYGYFPLNLFAPI